MNLGSIVNRSTLLGACAALIALALAVPELAHAQSRPTCETAASDLDRDGWGFEYGQTCRVVRGETIGAGSNRPNCSINAHDDGGGWGFENGRTCLWPLAEASQTAAVQPGTSRPACTAAAINNGDGFGWENDQSCRWTSATLPGGQTGADRPVCSAAAIDNGDGFGWEDNQSCRWAGGAPAAATGADRPVCSAGAFDNGDGFGWEDGQSCRWDSTASAPSTETTAHPTCSAAAHDNGGGWGWENDATCRFASNSPAPASPLFDDDGVRQCSANAYDNGNGWGFEYGQSCRWGDVRPASGSGDSDGAAPPPVSAAAPGFVEGTPICLTDSSDGNHDGYGYENDRTCRVVDNVTATADRPLLNTRWCQPWAEIAYGDYVLQNNTWNDSEVYSDNWSQCIELGGSRGNYIAKWDYNWLGRYEGNEYSVKSYPQVYYGRKTRNSQSGSVERLGLPANINQLPRFRVHYRYSETGATERNVALESCFDTSCEAEEWNKQFELMVWVNSPVTKTPGTQVAEATIDGKDWLVYVNPSLGWGYVAFVEATPSYQGSLDWNAFIDWTRYQGPAHGIWSLGNNTCMGAIEIGTETFWGSGTFTLEDFRVVRY